VVTERALRIKACLNGERRRDEHPAVPVTPAELAESAAGAVAAGAQAVHLHPRRADGAESLLAADIGAAVAAVRLACPGVPVGVSTSLSITGGDPATRRAAVAGWAELPAAARPDFASVNMSEPGLTALVAELRSAGIAAEAGVWSAADASALAELGESIRCLRILVEVIGVPVADPVSVADEILRRLDEAGPAAPRLLHGEQASCWPLVARAGELGLATRIGLEDTLTGPDGRLAGRNADLVRQALAIWAAAAPR
jgi:uncharacterized protein (DUF849 family)